MRRNPFTVIEQNNVTGGVSYWQGVDNQSLSDRYGVSLADYIHAMYGFIRQAKSKRVLMIGCGGGTLATMLTRARGLGTMVDINAASFEIARTYFAMPDNVECHVGDGAAFLRRNARRFDAIVLDAYSGGAIPRQFLRPAFFTLAKSRLARGGIVLANVLAADDDDRRPDQIARLMQTAWRDMRILDADGYVDRNVVVIAGAVRRLRPPRLMMAPARCARSIQRSLQGLGY